MGHELVAMDEVRAINSSFPFTGPMRRWKERGGEIVGWGCTYVPEEIIRAAGILPIRVTGPAREIQTDDGDAHLYALTSCSYVRTILQLGLDAEYSFLDGYVTTASCDGMRRLMDYWRAYVGTPFQNVMSLPRKGTAQSEQYYLEELQDFKKGIEKHFGVEITNDALREAIATHNHTRALVKELFELRKQPIPPITGAESFEIINAGLRMPRDDYNALLARLIEQARHRQSHGQPKARLMLSGSNLANQDFIGGLEAQGAVVVIEDLCTGARYWSDPVDENPSLDPMQALAHRYLHNLPCGRTVGLATERHDRLLELAQEYRCQGLVNAVIRNCMPNSIDRPLVRERFEAAGIQVLELDTEYGTGSTGQVATRAQAFLEMIQALAVQPV